MHWSRRYLEVCAEKHRPVIRGHRTVNVGKFQADIGIVGTDDEIESVTAYMGWLVHHLVFGVQEAPSTDLNTDPGSFAVPLLWEGEGHVKICPFHSVLFKCELFSDVICDV
jgi:hypothetical protein